MAQEHRFADLLSRVAREVTLRQSAEVCCGNLTLEQFQTLQAVSASDQLSIGALSTRLRVDLSTMSRNVTLLERNGHLTRSRSEDDARVVHVKLTPKGKRSLETLRCDERDVLKDVYEGLPADERPKVIKALQVLHDCLEASDAPGAACCAPCPSRKAAP